MRKMGMHPSEQQHHQPQQCHEAINPPAKRNNFLLQLHGVLVGYLQRHDRSFQERQPAARRGTGHSVAYGRVDALSLPDQFTEAVIITALGAGG